MGLLDYKSPLLRTGALLFGGIRGLQTVDAMAKEEQEEARAEAHRETTRHAQQLAGRTLAMDRPILSVTGQEGLLTPQRKARLLAFRDSPDAYQAAQTQSRMAEAFPDAPTNDDFIKTDRGLWSVREQRIMQGTEPSAEPFKPVRLQRPNTDRYVMARSQQEYDDAINNGFVESSGAVPGAPKQDAAATPFELEQQDAQRRKWGQEEAADISAFETADYGFQTMADQAIELFSHPGLSKITGLVGQVPVDLTDEARDAVGLLDKLQAQTTLAAMSAARQGSASGATGFGALNTAELNLLNSKVAALKRALPTGEFRNELKSVVDQSTKLRNILRKARGLPEIEAPKMPTLGGVKQATLDSQEEGREYVGYTPDGRRVYKENGVQYVEDPS